MCPARNLTCPSVNGVGNASVAMTRNVELLSPTALRQPTRKNGSMKNSLAQAATSSVNPQQQTDPLTLLL
jgi:hypothetical protein